MTAPPSPGDGAAVRDEPYSDAEIRMLRLTLDFKSDASFDYPPEVAREERRGWIATVDALRERVERLEALLREAMRYLDDPSDYYGNSKRTDFEARIDAALAAPSSASKGATS